MFLLTVSRHTCTEVTHQTVSPPLQIIVIVAVTFSPSAVELRRQNEVLESLLVTYCLHLTPRENSRSDCIGSNKFYLLFED